MKRILAIALAIALSMTLAGCGAKVERVEKNQKDKSMFVAVEQTESWCVVYHRETKVMYAVSYGFYNCGNFTLLVNPDGTPMVWEGA